MITQTQIDQLKWFHDFDFPDGLTARSADTEGAVFHSLLWSFIRGKMETVDFANKTVIDVGCWDGYFSFLAEELGARSVLAVDDFSQNWGTPACFRLAKELKKSNVTLMPDVSVYELSRRVQQTFDIVLFLGVYYHLHSPFTAFAQVRSVCHKDSLVIIEGECMRNDDEAFARFHLDNPHTSAFVPTTRLLREMLHACYLRSGTRAFLGDEDIAERLKRVPDSRLLKLAAQAVKAKAGSKLPKAEVRTDRVLVFAKPFSSENPSHIYRPPFGLERFDPRDFPGCVENP
jgi:tRNA (mo5U34)-methyltransferase